MVKFRNSIQIFYVLLCLTYLAGCTSKDTKNNNSLGLATAGTSNESATSPQSESPQTSHQVTEEEVNQFVHRYLNDDGDDNNRHCHDGYCYFDTSRGNIDVYWRNYGDEEDERNREYIYIQDRGNSNKVKIEINKAQAIVKASLRQHLDLFDHLSEITTNPELLPYLEKYKTLKMRFTSEPLSPDLKIILIGDQYISPHFIGGGAGIARCDFSEGIILINANSWNSCIKHDDVLSEFLVFHEIAHCDLKRFHDDDGENNVLSFMDQFLIENVLNQTLTGSIESCGSIDALNIFKEREEWSDQPPVNRSYIEDNFEQLYTEIFSKDKFYRYDESHYEEDHDRYTEVEDLSEFTDVVNNDLIAIKQKLQQLVQEQQ